MSKLLFKLRNVPDDEAENIRDLLNKNNIEFYETNAGSWGISMPAIWLHDDQHLTHAKSLIDSYQIKRQQQAKEDYAQQKKQGMQRNSLDMIKEQPLKASLFIFAVIFVLYVSLIPFVTIFK